MTIHLYFFFHPTSSIPNPCSRRAKKPASDAPSKELGAQDHISGLVPASIGVGEMGQPWPGSFAHFFNYFRNKVMLFWKAALLHKRILFFSRVPIGMDNILIIIQREK